MKVALTEFYCHNAHELILAIKLYSNLFSQATLLKAFFVYLIMKKEVI
jgi:hypothetical protein